MRHGAFITGRSFAIRLARDGSLSIDSVESSGRISAGPGPICVLGAPEARVYPRATIHISINALMLMSNPCPCIQLFDSETAVLDDAEDPVP